VQQFLHFSNATVKKWPAANKTGKWQWLQQKVVNFSVMGKVFNLAGKTRNKHMREPNKIRLYGNFGSK